MGSEPMFHVGARWDAENERREQQYQEHQKRKDLMAALQASLQRCPSTLDDDETVHKCQGMAGHTFVHTCDCPKMWAVNEEAPDE